jgi:hypothetical protein
MREFRESKGTGICRTEYQRREASQKELQGYAEGNLETLAEYDKCRYERMLAKAGERTI